MDAQPVVAVVEPPAAAVALARGEVLAARGREPLVILLLGLARAFLLELAAVVRLAVVVLRRGRAARAARARRHFCLCGWRI